MRGGMDQQFAGAMVGLAVSDALGRPTEFLHSVDAIRSRFGPDGVTDLSPIITPRERTPTTRR